MSKYTHIVVEVTLSEREYKSLKSHRAFTGEGTVEAVIRQRLFNSDAKPYGASKNPTVVSEFEYHALEIKRLQDGT